MSRLTPADEAAIRLFYTDAEQAGYRTGTHMMSVLAELDAVRAELERCQFDDRKVGQPQPEDAEIAAAHPIHTDDHQSYATAMRLVGARRAKADLVDLVTWLLRKDATQRARIERLVKVGVASRAIDNETITCPVGALDDLESALAALHPGDLGEGGA